MELTRSERVEILIRETESMTAVTKTPPRMDNPDGMADYLSTMTAYLARSGEIYAQSKLLLQEEIMEIRQARKEEYEKMKATDVRQDIQYRTRRNDYLIDLSEKLNHNLVHEGNNIRKQLQYLSDQMKIV